MAACAGDDPDVQPRGADRPAGEDHAGRRGARLSKRAGTIVTLQELVDLIGVDAAALLAGPLPGRLAADPRRRRDDRQASDNPVFYVQYAHARICLDAAQRRRPRACPDLDDFDPALLTHEQEGDLLRALAEFPRVVASGGRSCASRTGSRATSRTPPAIFHRFYDSLPGAAAGRRGVAPTCTAPGCCWSTRPAPCWPTASTCSASPRPSGCEPMRAHEAGWAHAAVSVRGPAWLREPGDVNALVPELWSRHGAQGRRRPSRSAASG